MPSFAQDDFLEQVSEQELPDLEVVELQKPHQSLSRLRPRAAEPRPSGSRWHREAMKPRLDGQPVPTPGDESRSEHQASACPHPGPQQREPPSRRCPSAIADAPSHQPEDQQVPTGHRESEWPIPRWTGLKRDVSETETWARGRERSGKKKRMKKPGWAPETRCLSRSSFPQNNITECSGLLM